MSPVPGGAAYPHVLPPEPLPAGSGLGPLQLGAWRRLCLSTRNPVNPSCRLWTCPGGPCSWPWCWPATGCASSSSEGPRAFCSAVTTRLRIWTSWSGVPGSSWTRSPGWARPRRGSEGRGPHQHLLRAGRRVRRPSGHDDAGRGGGHGADHRRGRVTGRTGHHRAAVGGEPRRGRAVPEQPGPCRAASSPRTRPPRLPVEPDQTVPEAPVVEVSDRSTALVGTRVVCLLPPDAEPVSAERWVRQVWPVTIEVECRLPAPQRTRLRGWERGDGSGLVRLAELVLP